MDTNQKYSKGYENKPICGLYACHVLTNKTVNFITNQFKSMYPAYMGRYGKGWKGSTYSIDVINFIKRYRTLTRIKPKFNRVARFIDMETTKKEKYLIVLNNHFVSVVDGMIIDQGGIGTKESHRSKNKQIVKVYKVTSKRSKQNNRK